MADEEAVLFWRDFFTRRGWMHRVLAGRLDIGEHVVTRWVNGESGISGENLKRLLAADILTVSEESWLVRWWLRKQGFDDQASLRIARASLGSELEQPEAVEYRPAREFGLRGFHDSLDFSRLFDKLEAGQEFLWLDTYCPDYNRIPPHLAAALRRGVTVRMLIIDPGCANARYRAEEIQSALGDYSPEKFLAEVEAFKTTIYSTVRRVTSEIGEGGNVAGSCEIRLYTDLPGVPMYIILAAPNAQNQRRPVSGYSSFFLGHPTAFYPHIEWEYKSGALLDDMHKHFERKWTVHQSTALSA